MASASAWYEEQQQGLGEEFLRALEHVVEHIIRFPMGFPEILPGHRRALLPRFPYALYHSGDVESLDVLACLHTRQSPHRWLRRT